MARSARYELLIGADGPSMSFRGAGGASATLATLIRGGNRNAMISGEQPTATRSNYAIGNTPGNWLQNVASYGRVRYTEIYPSIDLIFYGSGSNMEFDFEVKPGGDPRRIALSWKGAGKARLDENGNLLIPTTAGEVRWGKPEIYQVRDGKRASVAGRFRLSGGNLAAFEVPDYDRTAKLVIDPSVSFATFLGGSANDSARGITVDGSGNIIIAGTTTSSTLPTKAGVAQPGYGGSTPDTITGDVFVASLNPAGTALNWITYLGGNQDDIGTSVAVDGSGSIYVTGMTNSPDFPVKNAQTGTYIGAGGNKLNPLGDAFLTKLNSSGQLVYSTFFGGTADDSGAAVAVDSSGNAYITGATLSTNLPFSFSSFQKGFKGSGGVLDYCGGCGPVFLGGDAFVTKFDPNGKLLWTTYLGGSKDDYGMAIAVDKTGVYIAGMTLSNDFPVTSGAYQTTFGGASNDQDQPNIKFGDGWVAKMDVDGTKLLYATYLGGSRDDGIFSLAIDSTGAAYVAGATSSANFPVSPNAYQSTFRGPSAAPLAPGRPKIVFGDGFAAKLNPSGSALVYSTLLGGTGDDGATGIAVDFGGNAFIVGHTTSKDFPVTTGTYSGSGGESQAIGDAFFAQLNPAGTVEVFGMYMGGSQDDAAAGIAIDGSGNAFVAGYTVSSGFPVTKGSLQATFGGSNRLGAPYGDAFVAKISGLSSAAGGPSITSGGIVPVYSTATTIQPGSWFSIYGSGLASATAVWNGDFPASLGGTTVTVNGKNAYLWFVSAGQINAQAPDDTATGTVPVMVNTASGTANSTVTLGTAGPAFLLLGDAVHVTGIIPTPNGGGSQGNGTYDLLGPASVGAGFRPAKKGEAIAVYGIGFGPTNPTVPAGKAYTCPAAGCATMVTKPQITVGGIAVNVDFAGIVSAGLYQFNFTIPSTIGNGDQTVVATLSGGIRTQPSIVIPVQ